MSAHVERTARPSRNVTLAPRQISARIQEQQDLDLP
jgi:hypothetical protein